MAPDPQRTPPEADRLQGSVARLLRPLVRLLIRSGFTFPALADLLRELYVSVAETDFALTGKEQTDSRVSLLTGIHRKEVRRLRGAGAPVSAMPAALSRTSRILSHWLASPDYADERGRPVPLPRTADGGRVSFEALVESVTRDVRSRAVLDEWLDRKLVTELEDGRLALTDLGLVPSGGDPQLLYYFGRNLHDHIAAATANIAGGTPPFLERAVHYDGLSADLARRLEQRARDLATEALITANREAHAACESDPGGTHRWIFGTYSFRENAGDKPDEPSPPRRDAAS